MRTFLTVCLVALVAGTVAGKHKKADDKVKIDVYYEALCPHSKDFITSQLAPVWRDRQFRGLIEVELVPYGIATHNKIDGKWNFKCDHGPEECAGNKLQACILKYQHLVDDDKMDTIICLMNFTSTNTLDTCLAELNKQAESENLKKCANSEQGENLLADYGDKTDVLQHRLTFAPTVIFNEKYNQTDQVLSDLKKSVCAFAPHSPSVCTTYL